MLSLRKRVVGYPIIWAIEVLRISVFLLSLQLIAGSIIALAQ